MKKLTIYVILAALCLNFGASGQNKNPNIQPLKIGDKMPDKIINNIINSRLKTVKVSDFKGKLIILDFWSTWCSSCIKGFPELDSLQRKYQNKIQIFLVNPLKENDSEKQVKIVIDRVNAWSDRRLKLPVVLQDTALSQYFEFHIIPHCVWIDSLGVVLAITGKEEVTEKNIAKYLRGERLDLPVKNEKVQ